MRRRRRFARIAGLAVAGALAAVTLSAPAAAAGSIWDSFTARDLDGRVWTAAELEGRVVLLDFWATWCLPCLAEIPNLKQASERFGERGFLVLGVSMDRGERRELESFLRRQAIDWPQVHDGRGVDGPLARRFGVEAVPRTILVDRAGRVVGVDLRGEVLLAALPALLEPPAEDGERARPVPARGR